MEEVDTLQPKLLALLPSVPHIRVPDLDPMVHLPQTKSEGGLQGCPQEGEINTNRILLGEMGHQSREVATAAAYVEEAHAFLQVQRFQNLGSEGASRAWAKRGGL